MSSFDQLGNEVHRALSPGGATAAERDRAIAIANRLSDTLAPIETELIRSTDPASNGESFTERGVTELRTALDDFAGFANKRTADAFKRLRDAALVAISDWDAGARIVWSMAGLLPPVP